jgi:hypothetical protein
MTVGVLTWVICNWAEAVEAMLRAARERMVNVFFIVFPGWGDFKPFVPLEQCSNASLGHARTSLDALDQGFFSLAGAASSRRDLRNHGSTVFWGAMEEGDGRNRVSGAGWVEAKKSPVQGWAGTGEGGSSGGWKYNPRCVQEDLAEKRRRVKSAASPRPIRA